MNCREAGTRLQALADDQLGPAHRREVEAHLADCARCAEAARVAKQNVSFLVERLAHLRDAVGADLSGLTAPPPSPARGNIATAARRSRTPVLIIAALVIIAVAVAAFFILTGDGAAKGPTEPTSTDPDRVGAAEKNGQPSRNPGSARPVATPKTEHDRKSEPASTARPEAGIPGKTVRPVPPGIAALLPNLVNQPTQSNLDRAWAALAAEPSYAPRLITRIESTEDPATRAILVLVLGADNRSEATRAELFRVLAEDGAPDARAAAGAALARSPIKDAQRIPVFRGLRIPVSPIEDPAVLDRLLAAAETERDPDVVATLIRAVGPSEGPAGGVSSRLVELARSESEVVRDAALAALRASPPADIRLLLALIEDSSVPVTSRADLIGCLAGHREAVNHLSAIIRSAEEVPIQVAAVGALGDCFDKYARIEILETLRSSNVAEVRRAAVGVLSRDPSEETLETLNRVADEDDDAGVREGARQAALEMARVLKPEPDSK